MKSSRPLTFALLAWAMTACTGADAALRKSGARAVGTLVDAQETGLYINRQPQMELRLRVATASGESWEAAVRDLVPMSKLYLLQPGTRFAVRFDPQDRSRVVLAPDDAAADASAAQRESVEAFLTQVDALRDQLMTTGRLARAEIVAMAPMGFNVNGDNPMVSALVRVLPDAEPPFSGQVTFVIAGASLGKVQPGRSVWVRFDPADRSKLVLTGTDRPDTSVRSDPPPAAK